MELNEHNMVDFVFEKLVQKGIVVTREDIFTVLDLEMEYMVDNGFAEVIE